MTQPLYSKKIAAVFLRLLILGALVLAVILSGKFTDFMKGTSFIFVFLSGIFLTLISFSLKEIGLAFKHTSGRSGSAEEKRKAAYFWEATVRNFWMMGVVGSVISFVIALGSSEGGIFSIASRMSASYISAVYGMAIAVVCAIPALKTAALWNTKPKDERENMHEEQESNNMTFLKLDNVIGYILFIFTLGWAIFTPLLGKVFDGPLKAQDLFLYWPSLLVVVGGTIAIALFVGNSGASRSLTIGFALTGMLATLMGFVQAMMGFSSKEIQDIASAITFILSSCFIALLGMMLVGNPLVDRSVKSDNIQKTHTLNRIAWFVFPFMTLIILFLTFIMVVTPIKKG
jgi:flagellar motor component MotA